MISRCLDMDHTTRIMHLLPLRKNRARGPCDVTMAHACEARGWRFAVHRAEHAFHQRFRQAIGIADRRRGFVG